MAIIDGQVIGVGDYYELGQGNRWRADYCPITIRTGDGKFIQVLVNTQTMMNKTYMADGKGGTIQVGMVKPRIGDHLQVDGQIFASDDGVHSKVIKYVKKIIRSTRARRTVA